MLDCFIIHVLDFILLPVFFKDIATVKFLKIYLKVFMDATPYFRF